MNQAEFTRRLFLQSVTTAAAAGAVGLYPSWSARAAEPLKIWTIGIAKVGGKDWSAMEAQSGVKVNYIAKSARADEAIQKMVVGDGNKLYDAMTDNGGGMEDALAGQKAIVPLDSGRIPNWKNILPRYLEGGAAADTIRYEGKLYAVPYISN
nr:spermidine/putrescine ABC transporter substrate-binding protein [Alphaproteobacteria bacterium]